MIRTFGLIALCITLGFAGCTKASNDNKNDNKENTSSECNSPGFNDDFAKITPTSTYDDVKSIFGAEGDNFRNDLQGANTIKYYKWYPCTDKADYYVEVWFENGQLLLAHKTLSNNSCSKEVSSEIFSSLSNGMTYDQVKDVMGEAGDNIRNDYDFPNSSVKIAYYRFYNCSDTSKWIETWFSPEKGAILIRKSF